MSIALSIGNNLTTNGVFTSGAVNNTSVNNVTTFASVPAGGVYKLLSTQTASSSSSIEFTSGLDSTYKKYVFKCINIRSGDEAVDLGFQVSTDGGSTYATTVTSCFTDGYSTDDGASYAVRLLTGTSAGTARSQAQGTQFQSLTVLGVNDADGGDNVSLELFDPSNTTFCKHFIAKSCSQITGNYTDNAIIGGYFNTTSAVNAIKFACYGSTIESGIIKMYGVV